MSKTQVVGPYDTNNADVVQTNQSYTLSKGHRVVLVTKDGLTMTMPPNPQFGEEHIISADAGVTVNVAGGANPLTGGKVFPGTNVRWVWSGTAWT